jgi:hypothetical protein
MMPDLRFYLPQALGAGWGRRIRGHLPHCPHLYEMGQGTYGQLGQGAAGRGFERCSAVVEQ